jgi:hypothetical protein
MSLGAFCMMGGGAIGTALGSRIIEATSFTLFFGLGGALLFGLAAVAVVAVSDTSPTERPTPDMQTAPGVGSR